MIQSPETFSGEAGLLRKTRTCLWAIASLCAGILAYLPVLFFLLVFITDINPFQGSIVLAIVALLVLPLVISLAAVLTGMKAQADIRRSLKAAGSAGRLKGSRLATTGIVLGHVLIAILLVGAGLIWAGLASGARL